VRTKPEDRVREADGSTGAEPDGAEKRVTWAELFFDLVFVFAITQVSELLHHDHSWAGVGRALIVFVPVWWAWVGTTIHANRHDVDTVHDTLGIFVVGLGSLGMALALPGAYGDRGVLFGAAYLSAYAAVAAQPAGSPALRDQPPAGAVRALPDHRAR
jgi:Predicted membrane protein